LYSFSTSANGRSRTLKVAMSKVRVFSVGQVSTSAARASIAISSTVQPSRLTTDA
jgi:hypothetical protein